MKGHFKTLWKMSIGAIVILLYCIGTLGGDIYRALGTKYKLSGSSGDWCGIAWNPVEEESGEALLQQYGGSGE